MKNKINVTADNLVEEFYKEYESKNGKFLLFDLANANENANTKVLKYLLQYNNYQFLYSFLERVGLPQPNNDSNVNITDQRKALGPKDTGFIDLYIQYDDVHIIIENKIYGAGDTKQQLARYIATVNDVSDKDFEEWYNNNNPTVSQKTYVVYLTADGTKEPSADSLPDKLKRCINYYPINYNDDILPWLEEDVMPNITYADDGMMIAGMQQYIAFLKQAPSDDSSKVVEEFVKNLSGTDVDKYTSLLQLIKDNSGKDKDNDNVMKSLRKQLNSGKDNDNVMKSLRKQLGDCAEAIFSGDVASIAGDWILHFTPSFIILYKKSWAALDTRKYSIPSLYLYAGSTNSFLENSKLQKLTLGIDHLSPRMKESYQNLNFGNRGKTVAFELLDKQDLDTIECSDVNDQKARKKFYCDILNKISNKINKIDKVVVEMLKENTPITSGKILEKVVQSCNSIITNK